MKLTQSTRPYYHGPLVIFIFLFNIMYCSAEDSSSTDDNVDFMDAVESILIVIKLYQFLYTLIISVGFINTVAIIIGSFVLWFIIDQCCPCVKECCNEISKKKYQPYRVGALSYSVYADS